MRAMNRGQYPYKWLWAYAGDKILKPKAKNIFTSVSPRPITTPEEGLNPKVTVAEMENRK